MTLGLVESEVVGAGYADLNGLRGRERTLK
jgi:hypothetical protein